MLNERAFLKWPSRWNTPFHQTLNNEELRLQVGNLRFEVDLKSQLLVSVGSAAASIASEF